MTNQQWISLAKNYKTQYRLRFTKVQTPSLLTDNFEQKPANTLPK